MNIKKLNFLDIILVTILALYFSLGATWSYYDPFIFTEFFIKFIFVFLMAEIILLTAWKYFFKIRKKKKQTKIKKYEYFVFGGIIILVLIISLFIAYPSVGNCDAETLWNDLRYDQVSNWNPIPYLYIFIGIPYAISGYIFSLSIFQAFFVLAVTLYLFIYIRKNYFDFKTTLLFLILFVLNPAFFKFSVYASKDTIYSWCIVLWTLNLIEIIKSDTKWLDSLKNKIVFLFLGLTVLFFRHNGIIPFSFSLIYMAIFFKRIRKFVLTSFAIIISSFFLISGPLYRALGIDGTLGRMEAMGVVMNNLSYYHMHADDLSNGDKDFLYYLIPREIWYISYHPRTFNDIKFCFDGDVIYCNYNNETLGENISLILKKWLKLTLKNPDLFIRSYLNVTSPIWELKYQMGEIDFLYWSNDLYEERPKINQKFNELFDGYYHFITETPLNLLFVSLGEGLFIIIFSSFIVIRKTKFKFKYLLPFVPILANTLGIMVLITGEEYRFIYSQGLCYLPLLLFSFYDIKNNLVKKNII